ncbi:MAG TPA: serine/threonine-protein kinase [Kofleriaceae bacterium]|jgi:serine/threonine protein kinase|nr:serine/threonine-protein kinase [Kofleriaceae bacterium]
MPLAAGMLVADRYRADAPLGRGGMATVWRGVDVASGRPVAIKTTLAELAGDDAFARRLEREAKAASFLQHPHVVDVLALDRLIDGTVALVMELLDGVTLGDELYDHGPMAPRRALVLARQILDALAHAHRAGIIHRDLKPDNIMLARAGKPGAFYESAKVLDFGVVKLHGIAAEVLGDEKLTRTGVVHGTPTYMAPEQALGRAIDGRADLYAVGVLIFEMLTGKPPFEADDAVRMLRLHVGTPPPRLADRGVTATPELEVLVGGALAKRPTERYADAAAMIAALDHAFLSLDRI